MSDLPPSPPTASGPEDDRRLRFHPVVTIVLVALLGGVLVLLATANDPWVLWLLAALPLVAGVLHASGHRSEERTRRFFKAFLITGGVMFAAAVIVYGVCLAIVQSQLGG